MKQRASLTLLFRPLVTIQRQTTADIDSPKGFSFVEFIGYVKSITDLGSRLALFAGLVLVFSYLIFSIHFYPTGLTLADSFLFLLTTFAFGIAYILLLLLGLLGAHAISLLKKQCSDKVLFFAASGLTLAATIHGMEGLSVLAFFNSLGNTSSSPAFLGIIGFTAAGFGLKIWIERYDNKASTAVSVNPNEPDQQSATPVSASLARPNSRMNYVFALLCCPLFMALPFLALVNENFVMRSIGLRSINTTIRLSEENYKILESGILGQDIAALGCSISATSNEKLVHGVNLLWHGIGERSLVEIPSMRQGELPLVVELKRDGLFAFHKYVGAKERCLDLSGDILFDSASAQLSHNSRHDLNRLIDTIKSSSEKIQEIRVIGHSDPMAFKGTSGKNDRLAQERACTIGKFLIEHAGIAKEIIDVEGHGAREPKTLCKDWPVKETLGECFATNRRVEVRIKYKSTQSPSATAALPSLPRSQTWGANHPAPPEACPALLRASL